jgi:hypothetical protein
VVNVVSIALIAVATEVMLRFFARPTPTGSAVANVGLLPKSWRAVATRNRAILERAAQQQTYLVQDGELGWTVGPNRVSADYNRAFQEMYLARRNDRDARQQWAMKASDESIYMSSTEGLRSPKPRMSFASAPARRRIALIGDSFTFGLEVPYDQTWGHYLERALGPEFQVLNFGVDGYGVDQAYLRYRRDVAPWHPEIIILSVIADDFRRTMCVYGFLCFPDSEVPFPKPRFVVSAGKLMRLNSPLPSADSVFGLASIDQLPFIQYDPAYYATQWNWHFYHAAYSVRFLLSKFPRWPVPEPVVSEDAVSLVNAELIRAFVREAKANGSTPIVVFLPSRSTLEGTWGASLKSKEILEASIIEPILTPRQAN